MSEQIRSLADLTAAVDANHFRLRLALRWELCAACPVIPCNTESKACRCRRFVNERQRNYYQRTPAARHKNRSANLTPDQLEAKRRACKRYYESSKDALKVTRAMYLSTPEGHAKVRESDRLYKLRRKKKAANLEAARARAAYARAAKVV